MATDNKDKVLNVPTLRFPEFNREWEEHILSEYLEFKNGLNPDAKRIGKGIPFISVMDILANSSINYDNIRGKVEATDKEMEIFAVNNGDILFQRSSETLEDVGRANVYLDNRTAVYGGFVIRGRKIGNYDPLFFKFLLATPLARKMTCRMGAGAQHFNIGQDGLAKVSVHVPCLNEQTKIATLLRLLDERIATQNKIISNLQSLIKGLYEKCFNEVEGEIHELGNLCQITKGQQINGEQLTTDGDYYVMNGGIEPSGYYHDFNTPSNTISISEGGNSCGYIQLNHVPFWSGGHCYTLLSPTISVNYLYHYLKCKESDIMNLRIGSGLPNIQKKDLFRFGIIIPSKLEQDRLSDCFSFISQKIEHEQSILQKYYLQKQHLLHTMFI